MRTLNAPIKTAEELEIILELALQLQRYHTCAASYKDAIAQIDEVFDLGAPKREHIDIVHRMFKMEPGEQPPYTCAHHSIRNDPLGLRMPGSLYDDDNRIIH